MAHYCLFVDYKKGQTEAMHGPSINYFIRLKTNDIRHYDKSVKLSINTTTR